MRLSIFIIIAMVFCSIASGQSTAPRPAQDILNEAIAQAHSSNRTVMVIFHASWCSWCKRLDKAFADPDVKTIVDKNYVVTHLDVLERKEKKETLENAGGVEIMKKFGGEKSGLPFIAFLDAKGTMIANSNAMPENQNIGYPGAKEEIEAFIALLKRTANNMSDAERIRVARYFEENAPKPKP
jgi:thioredoxin-related protein